MVALGWMKLTMSWCKNKEMSGTRDRGVPRNIMAAITECVSG
jgi:hypothetical protein